MLAAPTNHTPPSSLNSNPTLNPILAIKSTNVLLDSHEEPTEAIILIQNGKILDIILPTETSPETLANINQGYNIKDYGDLFIFPGLVDSNVHLHADYDENWENIEYTTSLAAAGGVTTIVDNPIMCAPYDSGEEYINSIHQKIEKIQQKSKVDFGIFGILEPKTKDHIEGMLKAGVLGLKCYLISCFQNTIGNFDREQFEELIENLEESGDKYRDLLLMIHPELATDRELYLTSPCRTLPLRRRVDMLHSFKSIELGGAANKGSYIDDFEKSKKKRTVEDELGVGDDDEDEQEEEKELTCSIGEIQSATKLENRVWEAKEKTDLHDLVKYELSSYNFDSQQNDGESTPDSDHEFFQTLSKHSSKAGVFNFEEVVKNEAEEAEKKGGSMLIAEEEKLDGLELAKSHSCGGKINISPVRKSLFANIKTEEGQGQGGCLKRNFEASLAHIEESAEEAKRTQDLVQGSKEAEEDEEEDSDGDENENFDDIFKDRKTAKEQKSFAEKELQEFESQGPQPKQQESPESPSSNSNSLSNSNTLFTSLTKKLNESSNGNLLLSKDTLTTTDSPLIIPNESHHHIKLNSAQETETVGQTSPCLAERRRNSPIKKFGPLITTSWTDKEDSNESPENNAYKYQNMAPASIDTSPVNDEVPLESIEESPSRLQGIVMRNSTTPSNSSLLARRITFKNANSQGKQYPESAESTPLRKFGKFDSLSINRNSNEDSGQKEIQMNQSYRIFLANRHQSWEENAVSVVLGALRAEPNLKIVFQNLSLASSFFKIRARKKVNSAWEERLFADTSPIYLYFSEKMVKKGETKYKLSPPFRNRDNKKLLLEDYRLNAIDTVSSYHFYVPQEYKLVKHGNFRRAFGGMEVIGCSIQAAWTSLYGHQKKHNKKNNFSKISDPEEHKKMVGKIMKQICKTMCSNPAKILKIEDRKGRIAKGLDADLVVWDPWKVDKNEHLSAEHGFSGKMLIGSVCKTYLRGDLIYDSEGIVEGNKRKGEFVRL